MNFKTTAYFSLSALVQTTLAGVSIMTNTLSNAKNLPPSLTQGQSGGPSVRGFAGAIGLIIARMDNYGCWCYLEENHNKGKGEPVDALDEACKAMSQGYECAIHDGDAAGEPCVPWEVLYTSATPMSPGGGSLITECTTLNPGNDCAIRACAIEGQFINDVLEAFMTGHSLNQVNKHSNGFDLGVCKTSHGSGGDGSGKDCCGEYPRRFPFRVLSGTRGCCGNKTYDAMTMQCCDEESSLVSFSCI